MAQLKEGSIIKKSTGDEVIATVSDIPDVPTKTSDLENDSGFLDSLPAHNHDDMYYTESEVDSKLDEKVGNSRVLTDVPANAKFTDTVYSHPPTHPANMITGLPTSLPADGGNADTVGGFTVGVNVPADAVFTDTDTVTTINGKTGAISKADIVALGIPSQDTNTTYSEITTAEIDAGTASTQRTITGRRVKYILDNVVWDNIKGKPTITSGVSFYAGLSNEVIIPHNLSTTPTIVYAHPTTNPEGYLGEVWIRKDETNLYIGNSGQHTGSLEWVAILIGGH